jgi:hypothetical protein
MDHGLEPHIPLSVRMIRQSYVHYCKDAFPRYGEGRLDKLSYATFKAKALEHDTLHQELQSLYSENPNLKDLPAELRTRLVGLEVRMSTLEHELCMS